MRGQRALLGCGIRRCWPMKILLQRVSHARVALVETGEETGKIGHGLCLLVCAEPNDTDEDVTYLARKIAQMRVFEDAQGKMNKSVLDVDGASLVISQFTLAAEWRKGNRPSFSGAAAPEVAEARYIEFCDQLGACGVPVQTGRFGAHMQVEIHNDGPVSIWMDTNDR